MNSERNLGSDEELDDDSLSIDFGALYRTILAHRRTVAWITLGTFVLAAVVALLLPNQYTSTASFIPPSSSSGSGAAAALLGQLSAAGAPNLLGGSKSAPDTYVGILKSRSIADELIHRFNLKQVYGVKTDTEARKKLAAKTVAEVDLKSSIVTLSVTDRDPSRARDLAQAYLDSLRTTNGRLALTESSQRRMFFAQQLAKEKDDLEDAEVELKKTEESSGLIAPGGQTAVEIETIAQTRAQIAVRQVQLAAMSQAATDQNPDVVRLRSEIADLQGQLSRMQSGSGKATAGVIPTSKVPELQLDYVRKEREVKYHEALFEILAKQFESARMDEARDAPLLQVLDPASYPEVKSSPPRTLILLGGLFFGLIAGCGWVLFGARLLGTADLQESAA